MNSSGKNYAGIYLLQNRVFNAFQGSFGPFYLTGGTALGRFYLNHRHSDDIDLFANQIPNFSQQATFLRNLLHTNFRLSDSKTALYPDYIRIWIQESVELKVELVNDVAERWGEPIFAGEIPVDTVSNILANKLTALISRDEPKDVYDIVSISKHFSFAWNEVFNHALRKAIISEPDILMRFSTFPIELLEGKDWLKRPIDVGSFRKSIDQISNDFLLARENSLGKGKIPITTARPKFIDSRIDTL